jgi:sec-independent protein translocase protein TatA
MFGHWLDIMILCVAGLLIFGPKRVIEMGGALGKAWREFRESTKDLNLTALLTDTGPEPSRPQYPQAYTNTPAPELTPLSDPPAQENVVEAAAHPVEEPGDR